MATLLPPIPNDPIGETHSWREWFQRIKETVVISGTISSVSYSYQSPVTGFSITVPSNVNYLLLLPAGTLATGTLIMPAGPTDGQVITVSSSQKITALTVSPNSGQTVLNAPTTLQKWATTPDEISGLGFSYLYIKATTTWVRLT